MSLSTVALFSSSRRHGNTGQFIDRVALQLGIEVVNLDALRISPFDYDHRNRADDFEPLMQRVLGHEKIIFATPIYWYAVAPGMKMLLDRLSDFLEIPDLLADGRRLRGKQAFVLCTSISAEPASAFVEAFRETFEYLGMRFGGMAHVNCENGYIPVSHDPKALEFAAIVKDSRHSSA